MRILLLGGTGLTGRAVRETAPAAHTVVAPARSEVDIRDSTALQRAVADVAPRWVINASAYTDVDGAERDPDAAYAINATAVGELGRLARAHGCRVLHYSTDYVFDGQRPACYAENDSADPLNLYGAGKLAGERLLRESGAEHLLVRTQWVFGPGGRSFLSRVWEHARAQVPTRAVADEFGACTYALDLATVTWELIERHDGGQDVFHVSNRGRVSRFDVAQRIFAGAGVAHLVEPCSKDAVAVAAPRPSSSVLCVEKVERVVGHPMAHWTNAVDRFVSAQRASSAPQGSRS